MGSVRIRKISDSIISPLGDSVEDNYDAVSNGLSSLKIHEDERGVTTPFVASLFGDSYISDTFKVLSPSEGYTDYEKLSILSIKKALEKTDIEDSMRDTIFIMSSTKGNVSMLGDEVYSNDVLLGESAIKISRYFGNSNSPLTVSNACISGACAQIVAARLLRAGIYKNAVVTGCDCQSKFIISGFQSLKALSPDMCKPFDKNRNGLNLGEAAATIIYTREEGGMPDTNSWYFRRGSIKNDANHITGPSRTGEGSYRALKEVVADMKMDDIAFINLHGTATLYNDEMESIALNRAGLASIPVNCLKGYYGHTLGAAGVLESIISMKAVDNNTILGTKGYETCGTSVELNISSENRSTERHSFIKLLSGFGGCNAAILFAKGGMI